VALDLAVNGAMPNTKEQIQMEEQRGRIALALLADAGYDPRQAPEAWRLLDPKHAPADPSALATQAAAATNSASSTCNTRKRTWHRQTPSAFRRSNNCGSGAI
jgi:hypothetical protein